MDKGKNNQEKKPGRIKSFCEDNFMEIIMSGLMITAGVAGFVLGHDVGKAAGQVEASNHYRELMPELIDDAGWNGMDALREWILIHCPDAWSEITRLCDSLPEEQRDISKIFYNRDYIKNLLAEFSIKIEKK